MSKYMKSRYEYSKKRKEFGRQPLFQVVPAEILDSINPSRSDRKQYILRNPVHREVQATMPQSEHEANTKQLLIQDQGINHTEGGWPRDVHPYNEDHVTRHRRRVQHEDGYINSVHNVQPKVQHYIHQNNAIDMYQTYFADIPQQPPVETCGVQISNAFYDPHQRPVSSIVWTTERPTCFAVSYCQRVVGSEQNESKDIFVWDTQKQTAPVAQMLPEHPCWQLACSNFEPEVLIAGLENGTISLFDVRNGSGAVSRSSIYNSHVNPVSDVLYTHSRTNTEFFSGSLDGQCLWWDKRNLSIPTDRLFMSIKLPAGESPNMNNAEGVSCLEFDRGVPTKFLCGTESGLVINANRMGRSHSEVLASHWEAHAGPVRKVQRSPCTLRMFITCGDWSVRIWSEEVRTAPIIVTKPYRYQVIDVAWAPLRYSSYMAICEGGYFYYWDLLRNTNRSVSTLKVSKNGLIKLCPHANGKVTATGDSQGAVFLLNLSENMTLPDTKDKQLVVQLYNRETKREHILDTRVKEIHLKQREEEKLEIESIGEIVEEDNEDQKSTEEKYFRIVRQELEKMDAI